MGPVSLARRETIPGGAIAIFVFSGTGKHGVGIRKEFLAEELGEGTVALMKTIKRAIGPLGIMNLGKVWSHAYATSRGPVKLRRTFLSCIQTTKLHPIPERGLAVMCFKFVHLLAAYNLALVANVWKKKAHTLYSVLPQLR